MSQAFFLTKRISLYLGILLCLGFTAIDGKSRASELELKQGQFYLASDSSRIDGLNGIFEYKGNAQYREPGVSINADHLIGRKDKNGQFKSFTAYGSPAVFVQVNQQTGERLELKANVIKYFIIKQQLTAEINASLRQESNHKDVIHIKGSQIKIDNRSSKRRQISGKGNPLTLSVLDKGVEELSANANRLLIKSDSEDLLLEGDVIAKQQAGTVSAGSFRYNRQTKVSSFEKSNAGQVEIIQTIPINP